MMLDVRIHCIKLKYTIVGIQAGSDKHLKSILPQNHMASCWQGKG